MDAASEEVNGQLVALGSLPTRVSLGLNSDPLSHWYKTNPKSTSNLESTLITFNYCYYFVCMWARG